MKNTTLVLLTLLTIASLPHAESAAAETVARSGPARAALLEMYSSEGCSSCPPAEEWLSRHVTHPELWKAFVPVVFHVDYWDYLGWKDPYGSAEFSERQRDYADRWQSRSVYTPGFVLNGREFRGWHKIDPADAAGPETAGTIEILHSGNGRYSLLFEPQGKNSADGSYRAEIVLLGFGFVSDVLAGENAGEKLKHDFVVLDHVSSALENSDGKFRADFNLTIPGEFSPEKRGVAGWVTRKNSMEPVQAAGAYFES